MPNLASAGEYESAKILCYGDSGTGKTGALAALANAGYKLNIADFDLGLTPLKHYIEKSKLDLVNYTTYTDKMQPTPRGAVPLGTPSAYTRFMKALDRGWQTDSGESLGNIYDWGPDTVFVIDSFTKMGECIMRYIANLAGKDLSFGFDAPWMESQVQQESMLDLLCSGSVKCHVIVNAHVSWINQEPVFDNKGRVVGQTKGEGYPSALGKKLPPRIGRFFNTALRFGYDKADRRVIFTEPSIDLPTTKCPIEVSKTLPIQTGLLTVLEAITKGKE